MPAVVLPRADLPFPGSLPEFQRLFPDDTACAAYLEAIRWRDGFVCGWCGEASEPYRFANRPQVLRCRKCQRDNALTAGTVMERTRTPLSIWFPQHLQAYLNEFTFRFNRRFYPFNAFRSLLGISGQAVAPTYDGLYTGSWQHPRCNDEPGEHPVS